MFGKGLGCEGLEPKRGQGWKRRPTRHQQMTGATQGMRVWRGAERRAEERTREHHDSATLLVHFPPAQRAFCCCLSVSSQSRKHTRFHLSGLFANSYNFGSDTPSSVKVPRKEVRKTTSQTLGWERGKRREAGMAGGGWAGLSLSGVSAWPSQGDDED